MEIVEIIGDPSTEIVEVLVAGPQGPQGDTADIGPAISEHASREDVHGIPEVKELAEAAIPATEKGVSVATLSGGVLPSDQLPPLAISQPFVVNSEGAMLALDAQTGDVAIRTDLSKSFILADSPASELGNWTEILTPVPPVTSVAGKTGNVEIGTADVTGLSDALAGKADKDGPWKPLALPANFADAHSLAPDLAPPLRYRRNGDVLRFSGMIAWTEAGSPEPGQVYATIDPQDAPAYTVVVGAAVTGPTGEHITTFFTVNPDGELVVPETAPPANTLPLSHITIELT